MIFWQKLAAYRKSDKPMFANLYLDQLDQFCKHKLRLRYYIRYMDDVIILHHSKSTWSG